MEKAETHINRKLMKENTEWPKTTNYPQILSRPLSNILQDPEPSQFGLRPKQELVRRDLKSGRKNTRRKCASWWRWEGLPRVCRCAAGPV